jgi:hypothetical protein
VGNLNKWQTVSLSHTTHSSSFNPQFPNFRPLSLVHPSVSESWSGWSTHIPCTCVTCAGEQDYITTVLTTECSTHNGTYFGTEQCCLYVCHRYCCMCVDVHPSPRWRSSRWRTSSSWKCTENSSNSHCSLQRWRDVHLLTYTRSTAKQSVTIWVPPRIVRFWCTLYFTVSYTYAVAHESRSRKFLRIPYPIPMYREGQRTRVCFLQ